MSANLQLLVDSVDEGLIIVSPEGLVRLANRAAGTMFPVVPGKRLGAEEIMVQVSAAARGYLRLPLDFEIEMPNRENGRDRLRLKLIDSPLGGGYLVIIRNVSEASRYQTLVSNFANLLAAELNHPLVEFSGKLSRLLTELVPDLDRRAELSEEIRAALHEGEALSGRVAQLATFAQTFSKSPLLSNERIPVMELVSSLIVRVRPLLEARDLKFHMDGVHQELPVIYGSREWLVEALYGYIEHMVRNCRERSDLELLARPYGNYVSLQIRNHGRGLPKHGDVRSFLPFVQLGERGKTQGDTGLALGLPLCRQVVELMHGSMRLVDEDGDITAFVMEIPAGAPVSDNVSSLDAEQARRYAEDLSRLMQRQRQAHS